MENFRGKWNTSFSVILNRTLNVILGFIPRIHTKHPSLLDTRDRLFVTPKYDKNLMVDSRVKPENDYKLSLTKGLDVVCQCAALLERRVQSSTRVRKAQAVTRQTNECIETAESGVDKVVSSCEKNPNVHKTYMNFLRQRKTALDAPLHAVSSGRSMIEMLGVLAIIGVLSVGGIAGYSKAMMKFKINKTIEQMSMILANTRILYSSQGNYSGLYGSGTYIEGIKPIIGETDEFLSPFGGYNWLEGSDKIFHLTFSALPKEACMELATLNWGTEQSSGIVGLGIGIGFVSWVAFNNYDDCINSSTSEHIVENSTYEILYTACKTKLPISPATAANYCNICAEAGDCGITLFSK